MAITNFENAQLNLVIIDEDGVATSAFLRQADEPPGGGIGGSIADQQVAFGNGTDIAGSDSLKWNDNLGAFLFSYRGNPAEDGDLRFPYQFSIFGRNLTDDDDISVLSFRAGKNIQLGDVNQVEPFIAFSGFGFGEGEVDISSAQASGDVNIIAPSGNAYLQAGTGDVYLYAANGTVEIHDIMKLTPTADPDPLEEGMVWAGTDHHLYYYNGTIKKQLDN